MKLEQWVREAAGKMEQAELHFGHGTDNALDEACWMASASLGLAPDFEQQALQHQLEPHELQRLEAVLAERIQTRKPLAYLLGRAWFAGLEFEIDERVLVPRSSLAELILDGFSPWLRPEQLKRALDVGTGSGCLAIATAVYWPAVEVDAIDVSADALALARRNAERHAVAERVEFIQSDLFSALSGRRYDLILANPPYVPTAAMAELPAEYGWEPRLGLEAGEEGLDLVRRLLASASSHLEDGGILICEVGEAAEALDKLLANRAFTWLEFEHGGEGVFLIEKNALYS